jgi:hypothetical protein
VSGPRHLEVKGIPRDSDSGRFYGVKWMNMVVPPEGHKQGLLDVGGSGHQSRHDATSSNRMF